MSKASSTPAFGDVTPEAIWRQRRIWLRGAGAASAALTVPGIAGLAADSARAAAPGPAAGAAVDPAALAAKPAGPAFALSEPPTPFADVTTYNNFYEFGTDKDEPAKNAGTLRPRPWSVEVGGLVAKPRSFTLDELQALAPLEERVYRMRCVEGWSMVIPWIGFPLAELLKRVEPSPSAKYVEFTTLADPAQMPQIFRPVLHWPYTEGLRLDEAQHPLTLLTFGLYGKVLPNQNGAPVRVVVPWKYGFKSAKSLVRIRLVDKQPLTTWNLSAPQEYGFYSNVNPDVDHPRWSQATERRIGEDGVFKRKRKTLPFNGYGDQVATLYSGMDLRKFF